MVINYPGETKGSNFQTKLKFEAYAEPERERTISFSLVNNWAMHRDGWLLGL